MFPYTASPHSSRGKKTSRAMFTLKSKDIVVSALTFREGGPGVKVTLEHLFFTGLKGVFHPECNRLAESACIGWYLTVLRGHL